MLRRLFGGGSEQRAIRDPWNEWAAGDPVLHGGNTWAGVRVNHAESLEAGPVLGCITLIADIMGTLGVRQYDQTSGEDVPAARWLDEPQRGTDWPSWLASITRAFLTDGELFLTPLRDANGVVQEIAAIDSDRVQIPQRGVYLLDGQRYQGEIIHRMHFQRQLRDLRGTPVSTAAKEIVGSAIAASRYGGSFFGSSAIPPVVLELQGNPTNDQMKEIRESWRRQHSGPAKAHLPGLLINGSAKQLMIAPEQAQFLQTRRFIAAEIATNLFHLPPEVVGVAIDGSTITYANIESRWEDIIRSGVMPIYSRFERIFNRLLPGNNVMKFLPDKYLEADTATRFTTWKTGIEAGLIQPVEARRLDPLLNNLPIPSPTPAPVTPPGGGQ